MRWLDISEHGVSVSQKKTRKVLDIRLHSALLKELARYPRSFDTILTTKNGQPMPPDNLRYALQAFAAKHGFKIVPHGLRKNAVNALIEAGCTVAQTAAVSGQSLQMVEHYAKKRNQTALGSAAILQWERGQNANSQRTGK
jgi:integrase